MINALKAQGEAGCLRLDVQQQYSDVAFAFTGITLKSLKICTREMRELRHQGMSVKPEASCSMSIENTQACHCLY
jgi:hypothetical protein